MDWYAETFRATVALVVAGVALVAAGAAGLAGSVVLVAGLLAAAGLLFAGRDPLARAPVVWGIDAGPLLAVAWVGPVVAALVVLLSLDATAAEIQTLGGIVGLVGMANYFLRPLYRLAYSLLVRVSEAV